MASRRKAPPFPLRHRRSTSGSTEAFRSAGTVLPNVHGAKSFALLTTTSFWGRVRSGSYSTRFERDLKQESSDRWEHDGISRTGATSHGLTSRTENPGT